MKTNTENYQIPVMMSVLAISPTQSFPALCCCPTGLAETASLQSPSPLTFVHCDVLNYIVIFSRKLVPVMSGVYQCCVIIHLSNHTWGGVLYICKKLQSLY